MFINNEIDYDGGAIAQYANLEVVEMNFANCHFYGNKAGLRPFNTPIVVLNTTVVYRRRNMKILGYEFVSETRTKLLLELYENNNSKSQIVEVKNRGSGGALFITWAYLRITDCIFVANSANEKGGSLLSSRNTETTIMTSRLVTDSKGHRTNDGVAITSYSKNFQVQGLEIEVRDKEASRSLIFSHFTDNEDSTVHLTDVNITCPVNNRLVAETSSVSLFDSAIRRSKKLPYLTY